jgi:hypothetical protein
MEPTALGARLPQFRMCIKVLEVNICTLQNNIGALEVNRRTPQNHIGALEVNGRTPQNHIGALEVNGRTLEMNVSTPEGRCLYPRGEIGAC